MLSVSIFGFVVDVATLECSDVSMTPGERCQEGVALVHAAKDDR